MVFSLALPDGYFLGRCLVWASSLSPEVRLARGFELEVPDMTMAGRDRRLDYVSSVSSFLAGLGDHSLQLQWERTSDFRAGLNRFEAATAQQPPWHERVRQRCVTGLRDMMDSGQLRRERLTLWVTRAGGANFPRGGFRTAEAIDSWVEVMSRSIDEQMAALALRLPSGSRLRPLSPAEQFRAVRRHFQPQLPPELDDLGEFDPDRSILDNCLCSDLPVADLRDGNAGFVLDHLFHAVMVIRGWPNSFSPLMQATVLRQAINDYRVTQSFTPLPRDRELTSTLERLKKLETRAAREPGLVQLVNELRARVSDLQSGVTQPFASTTMLTVWDATQEGLLNKIGALKLALAGAGNAAVHICSQYAQAISVFAETLPGRIVPKSKWSLTEETQRLGRWMALSSSHTGDLAEADALFHTIEGSMAGVRLFRGGQPQHAVVVGATGSGKSAFIAYLLSLAAGTIDFQVIVEEGLSYAAYAKVAGLQTVVVRPNGALTLNPLHTGGIPLSGEGIAMAVALVAKMCDLPVQGDDSATRRSILSDYLSDLYHDKAKDWLDEHDDRLYNLAAESMLIEQWRAQMPNSPGFIEAWRDAMDYRAAHPREWEEIFAQFRADEHSLLAWTQTDLGERLTRSLVFSQPDAPQIRLRSLAEILLAAPTARPDSREAITADLLGRKLEDWCDQGPYGPLFDGLSTIDPRAGRGLHFELGMIPTGQERLKDVVAFYLASFVRSHVMSMPRAKRKLFLAEEAKRFQAVPEGKQLIQEGYEQLRKANCVCLSALQSVRQITDETLLSALFNNAGNLFLLHQAGGRDLEILSQVVSGLSKDAIDLIRSFPKPSEMPESTRASFVLHAEASAGGYACGVLRVRLDSEMRWVAKSDGDHFDQMARRFGQYDDPISCVVAEAFLASNPAGIRQRADGAIEMLPT